MLLSSDVADASTNPFSPDFGQTPHTLVGRESLLSDLLSGLATGPHDERFTTLLLGPRGSGKTVIQTVIEQKVQAEGWLVLPVDSATPGLPERIKQSVVRARDLYEQAERADPDQRPRKPRWAGFNLGPFGWRRAVFEAVRPEWDARRQLTALARHAADEGAAVLLTVDELHGGERGELRRLAGDLQHMTKKEQLPLAFVGAGLSEMQHTLLTSNQMTFFHRCARMEMPPLTTADAVAGLRRPILDAGGAIHDDALEDAAAAVGTLPYKLQLIGHNAWNIAGGPDHSIDLTAARHAARLAEITMRERLSLPAWHDLGPVEQSFLWAVAQAGGETDHLTIAQNVRSSPRSLAQTEQRLAASGYLTATPTGGVALSDLMPPQLVLEQTSAQARYRHRPEFLRAHAQARAVTLEALRCNEHMPRAKARCVLSKGHSGAHRSGRRRPV